MIDGGIALDVAFGSFFRRHLSEFARRLRLRSGHPRDTSPYEGFEMANSYCVRVCPNGAAKHTIRDEKGHQGWLEYNATARPGNTLFVIGELVPSKYGSMLSEDQVDYVAAVLKAEIAAGRHDLSKPQPVRPQQERIGSSWDKWIGYPPESSRASFALPPRELKDSQSIAPAAF
ncbi:hypothetical protein [Microvirga brassicacearum]|uniref:Uncharacterized protein n=1 Tax=Microvirga brassicacearum TaxID=2580413 RepID=A0A5N3P4H7_9HYPH|nr:hypothetical protein [Microvirga brassicacearum]KAB0264637.1 hypothetical protein FEZ63_22190 [Microvirga brassicacearum]